VVPALAERLARAGFAVASVDGDAADDIATVVLALSRGGLGFTATAIGIIGAGAAAQAAAARAGVPWVALSDTPDAGDTAVQWCSAHLVC
jgi:hypothetical protein